MAVFITDFVSKDHPLLSDEFILQSIYLMWPRSTFKDDLCGVVLAGVSVTFGAVGIHKNHFLTARLPSG